MTTLLSLLLACGGSPASETPPTPPPAPMVAAQAAPAASSPDPAKVAEALKVADAADGVEDKVATKCAGCALAMDGDEAHQVTVDGTTLHLCSSMCKENFTKDTPGNLVKLLD